MNLELSLRSHQGREQPDRTGPGDQHLARLPPGRAPADAPDVIPCLGHDAGWFEKNPQDAERLFDLDGKFRLEPEPLGAETMPPLDAALGVEAVAAHVPFAGR